MTAAGTRPVSSMTSSASRRPARNMSARKPIAWKSHGVVRATTLRMGRGGGGAGAAGGAQGAGARRRGEEREVAAEAVAHQRQLVRSGGLDRARDQARGVGLERVLGVGGAGG